MTRKTSTYVRKRAKQPQLLNRAYAEAHHTASFLATLRMCRRHQGATAGSQRPGWPAQLPTA